MKGCLCFILIVWCVAVGLCHAELVKNRQDLGTDDNVLPYAIISDDLARWLINHRRPVKGIPELDIKTSLQPQQDNKQSKLDLDDVTGVQQVDNDTDDVNVEEDRVVGQERVSTSDYRGKRPFLWYGYGNLWSGKPRRAFDRIGHYSSFGRFSKRARWLGLFGHRPSWLKWINTMNPSHPHHGINIRFADQ